MNTKICRLELVENKIIILKIISIPFSKSIVGKDFKNIDYNEIWETGMDHAMYGLYNYGMN